MDRRLFLLTTAVGVASALGGCGGSSTGAGAPEAEVPPASPPATTPGPAGALTVLQSGAPAMPGPSEPPGRLVDRLPSRVGNTVALTIDDGTDANVVHAYIDLAKATGIRLTFFVTAVYPSWTQHRDDLRPLVASGQIQLANHTWDHPNLRSKSPADVASQLNRCERFLNNTFGVTAKPFVRPPYGYHNAQTDAAAADAGFSTMVLWLGSLGDSSRLTEDQLLANAKQWLLAQHVVIGHANLPTVTHLYGQIVDILRSRSLQTATLDDVFYGAAGRQRTVG
jgi:peptidoglycan-N-acetylmuramic acid deacetylase